MTSRSDAIIAAGSPFAVSVIPDGHPLRHLGYRYQAHDSSGQVFAYALTVKGAGALAAQAKAKAAADDAGE